MSKYSVENFSSAFNCTQAAMLFRLLSFILLTGFLASCGTAPSISSLNDLKNFKLSDLRRNTPPIVEVKKDSLKELKSGKEQALAYHRASRKSRNTPAVGESFAPKDFDAGSLPTSANFPSIGLLPPLHPGGISSVETDEGLEGLRDATEPEITTEEPAPSE
jgi:hypothetical protein